MQARKQRTTTASSIEHRPPVVLVGNQHDSQRTMSNTRKNIYKKFLKFHEVHQPKLFLTCKKNAQAQLVDAGLCTTTFTERLGLKKVYPVTEIVPAPMEGKSNLTSIRDLLMMTQDGHSGKSYIMPAVMLITQSTNSRSRPSH